MSDTQAVVPGRRIITRHPEREDITKRREGRIDNADHATKRWYGATIGQVCDGMNADLGPQEDGFYRVEE